MSEFEITLPDVGEGIAEAELVEWSVAIGDVINEDDNLCAVMTDKATVEIPSIVSGLVLELGVEIGDTIAVGSVLARLKVEDNDTLGRVKKITEKQETAKLPSTNDIEKSSNTKTDAIKALQVADDREKPIASPAVRNRAREAGIDLAKLKGTGPAGRICQSDLDLYAMQTASVPIVGKSGSDFHGVNEVKIVGLRRKIAEKMLLSKSRIPHITIIEEIDVTTLEELRSALNGAKTNHQQKLTILPFLMTAMVKALSAQPALNAVYDDEKKVVSQHQGIHIGIATQTQKGLMVPVIRHCENQDIWSCAAEIKRVSESAKSGSASRKELSGSTITITSLGALGGIATTPIINYPEVAIVGVNKISIRPVWNDNQFIPRKIMNLSSSFDHRIIDGWEAAVFVQQLKSLLEMPAKLFIER